MQYDLLPNQGNEIADNIKSYTHIQLWNETEYASNATTGYKNVTRPYYGFQQRAPGGEGSCAFKAPYKNNHIFIMSSFIRCVLLGPGSFLQGQTKVS